MFKLLLNDYLNIQPIEIKKEDERDNPSKQTIKERLKGNVCSVCNRVLDVALGDDIKQKLCHDHIPIQIELELKGNWTINNKE
jgi:hypothetical protein